MEESKQLRINVSPPNLMNVCVDDMSNGEIRGRIYHCYEKDAVPFESVVELIKIAERLFDDLSYPQASTKTRNLVGESEEANGKVKRNFPEKVVDAKELLTHRGEKGTFITHVQYRQNSTWQGEMVWLEKGARRRFVDTLGFLRGLQSVF